MHAQVKEEEEWKKKQNSAQVARSTEPKEK